MNATNTDGESREIEALKQDALAAISSLFTMSMNAQDVGFGAVKMFDHLYATGHLTAPKQTTNADQLLEAADDLSARALLAVQNKSDFKYIDALNRARVRYNNFRAASKVQAAS